MVFNHGCLPRMKSRRRLRVSIHIMLPMLVSSSLSYSPESSADTTALIDGHLQHLLQDTTMKQEKGLSETLAWLQELPSESSCVQLAATKLMTECKLLDNPSEFAQAYPDLYLDDVKVDYAMKLATCEIVGAQPDQPYAPQNCETFLPSTEACTTRSWWSRSTHLRSKSSLPCYPHASEKQSHACLKTLRSSPQYWTSFSNAKFRAVNMCQLSRHAIERERTLQLHRNLTQATIRVGSSLREIEYRIATFQAELRTSTEGVKASQSEMKTTTERFRMFALDRELQAKKEREQARELMLSMQLDIGTLHDMLVSNIEAYNEKMSTSIDHALSAATSTMHESQANTVSRLNFELASLLENIRERGLQLALSLDVDLEHHHSKALAALQTQQHVTLESLGGLSKAVIDTSMNVDRLQDKVRILDDMTETSLAHANTLHEDLDSLGPKVKAIERAIAVLDTLFSMNGLPLGIIAITCGGIAAATGFRILRSLVWLLLPLVSIYGAVYLTTTNAQRLSVPLTPGALNSSMLDSNQMGYQLTSESSNLLIAAILILGIAAFWHNICSIFESLKRPRSYKDPQSRSDIEGSSTSPMAIHSSSPPTTHVSPSAIPPDFDLFARDTSSATWFAEMSDSDQSTIIQSIEIAPPCVESGAKWDWQRRVQVEPTRSFRRAQTVA